MRASAAATAFWPEQDCNKSWTFPVLVAKHEGSSDPSMIDLPS